MPTIATYASDSFYALNNIGIDFWSCFINDASMLEARNKIIDFSPPRKKSEIVVSSDEKADKTSSPCTRNRVEKP